QVAHPGDLDGILEGEEDALAGALLGRHGEEIPPFVDHLPSGDLEGLAPRQDVRQGALPAAVRAHDGVDLARSHDEVDPLQDLLAAGRGAEAPDLEHRLRLTLFSQRFPPGSRRGASGPRRRTPSAARGRPPYRTR